MENLIGNKYGRLTVIDFAGKNKHGTPRWLCRCDCGKECQRYSPTLKQNETPSCGCYKKEVLKKMSDINIKHGMSNTRLYGCYKGMMSRCYREKDIHYKAYGGRGIMVCDEWKHNPTAFIEWAKVNGYSDNLTLERIDVNGNYEPSNCTWVPMSEQYKNKQSNCKPMPEYTN